MDVPAGTAAAACGSAPELTKTSFSVTLELLCPELSNMTQPKVRSGSWIQGAEMLQTRGFVVIHKALPAQISTASHMFHVLFHLL